ncbi:unnamed protein product [Diplocarpon coronariae]|uniref:Velvet domain-containing protein n=1 Tax=Diplocarpon coronariae TaxID=2795749 RepID=A0A218YUC1_9HELO|nr:hypothetical protein JHW43_007557 [Diplocarpon mali]OWO99032.1 hypothetical protein B2J93_6609 [Marssonina coronariae]
MLELAVQPPRQTRPGRPLYPPIAARISSETSVYEELSRTWAAVTLISSSGETLDDRLGGKVADSAHPLPASAQSNSSSGSGVRRDRAYFYFPDLVIYEPGNYRVRVSLMQMDYSSTEAPEGVARIREFVDSRPITVEEGSDTSSQPSSGEREFLRILENDGVVIASPSSR